MSDGSVRCGPVSVAAMPDFVDVAVDFEVDLPDDLPPADSASTTAMVKAGRYAVVLIRHFPSRVIPKSQNIEAGDIWYGISVGNRTVWVRAVKTIPVS